MGHALGFKILAEGVENAGQLACLRGQGCDIYQGYLCSRPVPAADFVKLLGDGVSRPQEEDRWYSTQVSAT